jgi:hypothetical protein
VIEQPPSVGRAVRHVYNATDPVSVAMAIDPGLDPKLTERHTKALQQMLPDEFTSRMISSPGELADALAGETMDIAYLYCHGAYLDEGGSREVPSTVLKFGDTFVSPTDISNWRRSGGPWPRPHWPNRKPLVLLNGCHTTEFTTATLGNFVNAFVDRAGAAGVIGTEIAIDQGVAGWAAQQLLQMLHVGALTVGESVRYVRWTLLNKGNTIGLAFTLHAIAQLQLRPTLTAS